MALEGAGRLPEEGSVVQEQKANVAEAPSARALVGPQQTAAGPVGCSLRSGGGGSLGGGGRVEPHSEVSEHRLAQQPRSAKNRCDAPGRCAGQPWVRPGVGGVQWAGRDGGAGDRPKRTAPVLPAGPAHQRGERGVLRRHHPERVLRPHRGALSRPGQEVQGEGR